MAWATLDVETTIGTSFKRKGNPFDKNNFVVAAGIMCQGETKPTAWYFGRTGPAPGWLAPYLKGKLVVGHNIKFDLLHALQDEKNLELWMDYVAKGGNVWDTQLAEYLLEGMTQENHYLSLNEVSARYGGDTKVDEVSALWEAGVDTPDIDKDLLIRYLIGGPDEYGVEREGDIGNTTKVFLAQLKRARDTGQLNSILLNMGSLLCTIEMERNGMFVNGALGMQLAEELSEKIGQVAAALQEFVPADLPFPFKWSSPVQKSALLFGGKVKYARREYKLKTGEYVFGDRYPLQECGKLRKQDEGYPGQHLHHDLFEYTQKDEEHLVLDDGSTVEYTQDNLTRHALSVVFYKSGKNAGTPKTKKVKVNDFTKPKSRLGEDYYIFPGYTTPSKKWESATPGVYSTSSEVIKELGNRDVPFLKLLSQFTGMTKDLGTYYFTRDEKGEAKGMLTLMDELGIIHHKINHTSVVTGRFSSSDPNLQNIPKGNKSQVKRIFQSRFGKWVTDDFGWQVWVPRGKVIQSDFTALEIYIQALLTGCLQLIEDLKAGLDMHCVRLATKEGMPYDEVVKLAKGYKDDDGVWHDAVKEWDYKRTGAKVFSFQRAYGAGVAKIAESTGLPVEEVEALVAADNKRYPEIEPFFNDLSNLLRLSRKPWRTMPHPDKPGVICHLGRGYYRTPDNKLYAYNEHPAPDYKVEQGVFATFSPTEIKNYIVQGEGGEWAKAAMWLAVRSFYYHRNFGHLALLVNQVHDALYADADDKVAFEAAALLHACMEAASDFMEWKFNWKVAVPVPSDTTWGDSMMEEEKIPGVLDRAREYRSWLRETYMAGYIPSFINQLS